MSPSPALPDSRSSPCNLCADSCSTIPKIQGTAVFECLACFSFGQFVCSLKLPSTNTLRACPYPPHLALEWMKVAFVLVVPTPVAQHHMLNIHIGSLPLLFGQVPLRLLSSPCPHDVSCRSQECRPSWQSKGIHPLCLLRQHLLPHLTRAQLIGRPPVLLVWRPAALCLLQVGSAVKELVGPILSPAPEPTADADGSSWRSL